MTAASRSRLVAATRRKSTRTGRVPPTRSNSRSCSARSSLACRLSGSSPISSRNSVPPSASSSRPFFMPSAPVNAPFSWPKSSDSSSDSVSAAQLIATNGRVARALLRCTARATSSLPVPLSPRISTVASVCATRAMRSKTARIGWLRPTMLCSRLISACSRSLLSCSRAASRDSSRATAASAVITSSRRRCPWSSAAAASAAASTQTAPVARPKAIIGPASTRRPPASTIDAVRCSHARFTISASTSSAVLPADDQAERVVSASAVAIDEGDALGRHHAEDEAGQRRVDRRQPAHRRQRAYGARQLRQVVTCPEPVDAVGVEHRVVEGHFQDLTRVRARRPSDTGQASSTVAGAGSCGARDEQGIAQPDFVAGAQRPARERQAVDEQRRVPVDGLEGELSAVQRPNAAAALARGRSSSGDGMIRPWERRYAVPASTPLTATSSIAAHSSRSAGNGQPRRRVKGSPRIQADSGGVEEPCREEFHPRGAARRLPVAGRPHVAPAASRVFRARSIYRKSSGHSRHCWPDRQCRPERNGGDGGRDTVGVTVVAADTPNERVTIEASVWLRRADNQPRRDRPRPSNVPHDPSLHPSLACPSLEQWVCPGVWTDTGEDFRRISTSCRPPPAPARLSDRLVGLAVR